MLKRFKQLYHDIFKANQRVRLKQQIAVKNHIVEVNGKKYFIGKAMVTDVPELLEVERTVYQGKLPWNYTTMLRELKREHDRLYLVLRYHDRLVAFIGCSIQERTKDCHITNLAVTSDFQHRGLAYFLLTVIIKKARALDYKTISLEVRSGNHRAQHLYSDLGFKRTGIKQNYYVDNQEDAIDMQLDICGVDEKPNNYGM